jgi:cell division protein ZapE
MNAVQASFPLSVDSIVSTIETSTGVTLDPLQQNLAQSVANFLLATTEEGSTDAEGQTGFFIYGPPGRGKTWLMTQLFAAAPFTVDTKRHVHFHDFFRTLQQQLGPNTSTRKAIDATLTELLTGTELFFFDELHVHDPGSAALLNNLLAEIVERGIPTLVTSNYEPEGLLPDAMFHHVIEPSIKLLRNNFEVQVLDAGTDYRTHHVARDTGFASGKWLTTGPEKDTASVLQQAGLVPPKADEAVSVLDGHRALHAAAVRENQIWFDFSALLDSRSTTVDYMELAEQFDSWVLLNVPRLSETGPAARQRFVTLIDVLVERDLPLTVCAEVTSDAFVDLPDPPPDLFRTKSRLALLGSVDGVLG